MPHFVDTNVVVYSFSRDPKQARAAEVVREAAISVQVLNELTNVARNKWRRGWPDIAELIAEVNSTALLVVPVDETVHAMGRHLAERYRLAVYDSFIVAAALLAGCDTLFSEDMHDGLEIEGRLRIRNPFA